MGILVSLTTFVLFYLMTVFTLSWGTSALGYTREKFLLMQLFSILFFAVAIPISALLAEGGRRPMLIAVNVGIALFGLVLAPMFDAGTGRRGGDDGARDVADGPGLRSARHGALRAVPDLGALLRQFADVQPGRHLRRLARSVRRDLPRHELRPPVRRLLPERRGACCRSPACSPRARPATRRCRTSATSPCESRSSADPESARARWCGSSAISIATARTARARKACGTRTSSRTSRRGAIRSASPPTSARSTTPTIATRPKTIDPAR